MATKNCAGLKGKARVACLKRSPRSGLKGWKLKFEKDYHRKLEASQQEYNLYKKKGEIIHFQQAGEKLFSAVSNYLMVKHNKKVSSNKRLRQLIKWNVHDKLLLAWATYLHIFFYESTVYSMPLEDVEDYYVNVMGDMKQRAEA